MAIERWKLNGEWMRKKGWFLMEISFVSSCSYIFFFSFSSFLLLAGGSGGGGCCIISSRLSLSFYAYFVFERAASHCRKWNSCTMIWRCAFTHTHILGECRKAKEKKRKYKNLRGRGNKWWQQWLCDVEETRNFVLDHLMPNTNIT